MLTLETITDKHQWNSELAKLPYAHVLQTWEWGQFKHETTGWYPHRWVFKRDGEIVAMCSMGERKLGPASLMYAPKGPAMDYSDTALVQEVLSIIQAKAKEHRAVWVKIDPDIAYATGVPNEEDDTIVETGHAIKQLLEDKQWSFSDDQIQFRNTVTIDLTQAEDDILMAMSGNTRRKVRQAYKKDVTIRDATLDDLDTLYKLYDITGDRNDFLIRPKEYYLKLWRYFMENDLAHALIAEYDGLPIAQVILFHFSTTCWYFYGASSNKERNRMPNYALQWEAIKWAQAHGYQTYDMWGAPNDFNEDDPMWGVFMFKQGFRGTVERRLGAWDYAPSGLAYSLYTEAVPKVRKWLRALRS
ncbi:MAG: peptidoglycan bridge formation glycyltransferase FemA/FemB family protein [Chloroflexota bacterium]